MLAFDLDEQQALIKESISKFIQKDYHFENRHALLEENNIWRTFSELGWLAIPFAEEHGGIGGSAADLSIVMQELGKGLLLEPYFESIVMAGKLLELLSVDNPLAMQTLASVLEGDTRIVLAVHENQTEFSWQAQATQLIEQDDHFILSGEKQHIVDGARADVYLVSAELDGHQCMLLLPATAQGLASEEYSLIDGKPAINLSFSNVAIQQTQVLYKGEGLDQVMEAWLGWINIALSAELLGMMQSLLAKTVEYAKTRKQFSVPISFFQALQHRIVDMDLKCEQTQSLLLRAIDAFDNNKDDLQIEMNALGFYALSASKQLAEEAIQIHGGMGLTDELDIGHYAKRILLINHFYRPARDYQTNFCMLRYR